jgi:hypothetical protein
MMPVQIGFTSPGNGDSVSVVNNGLTATGTIDEGVMGLSAQLENLTSGMQQPDPVSPLTNVAQGNWSFSFNNVYANCSYSLTVTGGGSDGTGSSSIAFSTSAGAGNKEEGS